MINLNDKVIRRKTIYYLAVTLFIITVFLIGTLTFIYSYPFKTIEIRNVPIPVNIENVNGNKYVMYQADYCVHTNQSFTLRRQFISDKITTLPDVTTHLEKGCSSSEAFIKIPAGTSRGDYIVRFTVTYKLYGLRTIVNVFETESFHIEEQG